MVAVDLILPGRTQGGINLIHIEDPKIAQSVQKILLDSGLFWVNTEGEWIAYTD
jgi:hypothetical protein